MSGKVCSRLDCSSPAWAIPVIVVWGRGHPKLPDQAARGALNLPICEAHAKETTAQELITDEGWAMICKGFRDVGRAEPDRASAELEWNVL